MLNSLEHTTWVRSPSPQPKARYRLFCLPYGGGDATLFSDWPDLLPANMRNEIEICTINLPGRLHRIHDRPLFTTIVELVNVLVPRRLTDSVLFPYLDRPFALFGVSLGGLIMFEVARALAQCHHISPLSLCIASCRAPHSPVYYPIEGDEYILNPIYRQQSSNNMNSPLATLHADALLGTTYIHIPGLVLDCPITLWGGIQDELVSPNEIGRWQVHTMDKIHLHWLPGSHFFVRDARVQIRTRLLEHLAQTFPLISTSTPLATPFIKPFYPFPIPIVEGNAAAFHG